MLISTIQKDIASSNIHELVICLTVLPQLMNATVVQALGDSVIKLLSHRTDIVRKKSLLVMQKMQMISPGSISISSYE